MELIFSLLQQSTKYCDNMGTTYLGAFHSHMKHIKIDFHFVCDKVFNDNLHVSHVSSQNQLVNVLTKSLSHQHMLSLRSKIGILQGRPLLQGITKIIMIIEIYMEHIILIHPTMEIIPNKILQNPSNQGLIIIQYLL